MVEKRRVKRYKEDNDVAITIVSEKGENAKEKVVCSQSKDISLLGTKIQINYFLPVNSLLKLDFSLKDLYSKISAVGQVRWIKALFENKSYEAGVEFVETPAEEVEKREKYIAKKR